ncbi:MAG: hypothetical protein Q8N98_02080 [bacterium]|nr:hypothetical protein [bacterium]
MKRLFFRFFTTVFLVGMVVVSTLAAQKTIVYLSGAQAPPSVVEVKKTNITESSLTVSWRTSGASNDEIEYRAGNGPWLKAADDRIQKGEIYPPQTNHHATIRYQDENHSQPLLPETSVYFKIGSHTDAVTTAPKAENPPPADYIYGTVLNENGNPAEGALVYLTIKDSSPLSAITRASGNWTINLAMARTGDLKDYYRYSPKGERENLVIVGKDGRTSRAMAATGDDKPVPTITLGKDYDFIQALEPGSFPSPVSSPPDKTGFSADSSSGLDPQILRIGNTSAEENPTVKTNRPVISGAAPPTSSDPQKKPLTIIVESDQKITDQITVGESGLWDWVPPQPLSPGEHTITIIDSSGKKTIRNFNIAALAVGFGEENWSTPSGQPSPSPTPSTPPSPTPAYYNHKTCRGNRCQVLPCTIAGFCSDTCATDADCLPPVLPPPPVQPPTGTVGPTVYLLTASLALFLFSGIYFRKRIR